MIGSVITRRCDVDPKHGQAVAVQPMPEPKSSKYLCLNCAQVAIARLYFVRCFSETLSAAELRHNRMIEAKHALLRAYTGRVPAGRAA